MHEFRVIVVEDGKRTTQLIAPLERLPHEGELIALPDGARVKVRHVINAARDGLEGVVLAWRLPIS